MKNNTNQPGVGQRPKTVRQYLDGLSTSACRLALALSNIDDADYCERMRLPVARAERILSGFERWPDELRAWKELKELRHYHGQGRIPPPPWLEDREAKRKRPSRLERERIARDKHERRNAA